MMAVTATEKPMTFAILATLLRPGAMLPADPGWPAHPAVLLRRLRAVDVAGQAARVRPDVVFQFAGCDAGSGERARAGSRPGARRERRPASWPLSWCVHGTRRRVRQLSRGTRISGIDLCRRRARSRAIGFPSSPSIWASPPPPTVRAACPGGRFSCRALSTAKSHWLLCAWHRVAVYGAAAAANPWCAIPLASRCSWSQSGRGRVVRPVGAGLWLWARVGAVGVAAGCFMRLSGSRFIACRGLRRRHDADSNGRDRASPGWRP